MSDRPTLPRMLDRLLGRLDEIERSSDWEYRFVCDLLERFETGAIQKLTAKLHQISQRYP